MRSPQLSRLVVSAFCCALLALGLSACGSSRSSSSSPSSGGGNYTQQVRAQLDRASQIVQGAGYRKTHDYEYAAMNDNATKRFDVRLNEGMTYKLVAACDNDCSDIDMKLFDQNGNLIDSDVSGDDIPIVDVTPSWSGPFTVEMRMYTCSNEPCFYGIAVYGRSSR